MEKKTYHFTRITCNLRELFPDFKGKIPGELLKILRATIPTATCKLLFLDVTIEYHPRYDASVSSAIHSLKIKYS